MEAPSFLYSGIDKETMSLSEELNSLGGGDAQATHFELHAILDCRLKKNDEQLLWPYENMVGLRDITLPVGSPVTKCMKYYAVDSVAQHNSNPADSNSFGDISLDAAHWVNDGFNSCILSIGMRASGKTYAMFGEFGVQKNGYGITNCLAGRVLEHLYEQKQKMVRQQSITIAISAWYVQQQQIIDLVAPVHNVSDLLDFASVECPELSTACRVLHECRARAPSCIAHDSSDTPVSGRDRGHFFMRILLHTRELQDGGHTVKDLGSVSYMYLVDLAGLTPTDDSRFTKLSEEDKIAARANNLQLQCLFKVLGEMRSLSAAASANPLSPAETALATSTSAHLAEDHRNTGRGRKSHSAGGSATAGASIMKMTSARDSKLTTILAPIIQGNVKTSVLLFLQDGVQNVSETHNLLSSLGGVTEITSACHRVKDISLRSLGLVQHEDVLGPYYDSRHASMMQPSFAPALASPPRRQCGTSPTPQSTPGRTLGGEYITDTSTDYGEIDLDHILSGEFNIGKKGSPQRAGNRRGRKGTTTFFMSYKAMQKSSSKSSPPRSPLRAHYDQRAVSAERPSSLQFVEHRHAFNHDEAHRAGAAAAAVAQDHHAHYDLRAVSAERPSSPQFVEHRHAYNHDEAHRAGATAAAAAQDHHAHYDQRAVPAERPSSPQFVEHRHAFNHDETHRARAAASGRDHHLLFEGSSLIPEHSRSDDFAQQRRNHYHAEAHPASDVALLGPTAAAAFLEEMSPACSPAPHLRSSADVVQVLDEFHDLMEELENENDQQQLYGSPNAGHALNTSHTSAASSIGWPRQVVNDFLQSNRHAGFHGPLNEQSYERRSPPRGRREYREPARNISMSSRQHVQSIGPGEARYGADESFFTTGSAVSSAQSTPRRERRSGSSSSSPQRRSGVDVSMIADSLFGDHVDASFDGVFPTKDDNYYDEPHAHRVEYKYRHDEGDQRQSARSMSAEFAGIGDSTAEPVRLSHAHVPRLSDTAPLDLDTVNYITSSYADFFQNSLGDDFGQIQSRQSEQSEHWEDNSERSQGGGSRGGSTHSTSSPSATPTGSPPRSPAGSRASSRNFDMLNNSVDSLELEEVTSPRSQQLPSDEPTPFCNGNYSGSRADQQGESRDGGGSASEQRRGEASSWASTVSMTSARSSGQGSLRGETAQDSTQDRYRGGSQSSCSQGQSKASRHSSKRTTVSGEPFSDDAIPTSNMSHSEALAEVESLRRTNQSLAASLSDESSRCKKLEEKLQAAQDDLLEVRTQYEVQQDNHALQEKQLKSQLRAVCDNQSLTDVFATFEDNVARLVRENEALRQINLQLEAKELDSYLHASGKDVDSFDAHNKKEANEETFRLHAAKKENLRLLTRLKKSGLDREALKKEYEELKLKERHFLVNSKIANDCARRLRTTHCELVRTKRELEIEAAARAVAERDLHLIRDDTAALRTSEAALKEERARHLSEVAALRERVREVDHERKRMFQLNRFVNKHATSAAPDFSSGDQQHQAASHAGVSGNSNGKFAAPASSLGGRHPYRSHIAFALGDTRSASHASAPDAPAPAPVPASSSGVPSGEEKERDSRRSYEELLRAINQKPQHDRLYQQPQIPIQGLPEGTVAQAGLSDAQYHRIEESDGIDPNLEISLTAMHESLIATTPQLLPLFRKLTSDIHSERTRALQKRSQLLSQIGARQYEIKSPHADQSANNHNIKNKTASKTAAAYSAMLKAKGKNNYFESYEEKSNVTNHSSNKPNKSVRF